MADLMKSFLFLLVYGLSVIEGELYDSLHIINIMLTIILKKCFP